MKWHRLASSAVVVGMFVGCQSGGAALARDPMRPSGVTLGEPVSPPPSQKPNPEKLGTPIRQTVFEAVASPFPALRGGEVAVSVRAHVNGQPIFDEEVKQVCLPALMGLPFDLPEAERTAQQAKIFRQGLEQIIDREVILQDAFARLSKNGNTYLEKMKDYASKDFDKTLRAMKARSGKKTDEEFKALLEHQGQTLEGIRRQFERNFMAREYVRSMVYAKVERAAGHQQIVEYYQEHSSEFQAIDGVKWQDIFIDASRYKTRPEARAMAEDIARRARAGEDFAKLIKYDNGDSTFRNGDGFGTRRGEIKPIEAEPLLFRMKDGEVGPVIEIPTGFHVVRLVKRTYPGLLPLDKKLQKQIRDKLQNEVVERESKNLLDELKAKAAIDIHAR